jgi:hypothetical protein
MYFWRMIRMYKPAQIKIPACIDIVYINGAKKIHSRKFSGSILVVKRIKF